jgi:hypothetical protein
VKLESIFKRLGVEIVKTLQPAPGQVTLFLRVGQGSGDKWRTVLEEYIPGLDPKAGVEVSKVFFANEGNLRYLWRFKVVTTPEKLPAVLEDFGNTAIRTFASTVEVTSVPLIGRATYSFDPTTGKTKGVQPPGAAGALLAASGLGSGR